MKTYRKLLLPCFIAIIFLSFVGNASATMPVLSLSATGTGDNVTTTVTGDPNSNITLYYNLNSGTQNRIIGNTNSNGFFSIVISPSSYGITTGQSVYVVVNSQQSSYVVWPFSSSSSTITLSPSSLSMSVGQTSIVTVSNNNYYNNYGTFYISNNSNPNVATTYLTGGSLSIYASTIGSTTITVCQNSSTNSCATLYVTVSGSSSYQGVGAFTIPSLNLSVGNSATITSANSGSIYTSSNSNPGVASVSYNSFPPGCDGVSRYSVTTGQPCYYNYNNYNQINSNTSVVITALSPGVTSIILCQNYSGNNCNTTYVTVTNTSEIVYPTYPPTYPPYPLVTSASCYFYTTLRIGMSGIDVDCLQQHLLDRGYLNGDLNSYFDGNTQNAVMAFQQDNGLFPDGVVGRLTRTRLLQTYVQNY